MNFANDYCGSCAQMWNKSIQQIVALRQNTAPTPASMFSTQVYIIYIGYSFALAEIAWREIWEVTNSNRQETLKKKWEIAKQGTGNENLNIM